MKSSIINHRSSMIAVLGVLLLGAACSNKPPEESSADCASRINAQRAAKDAEFQKSNDPIPENLKSKFLPLAYFPPDCEYRVPAALKADPNPKRLRMPTSTGAQRLVTIVGTLNFTLKGQQMSLLATTENDLSHLTVMFSDMTSGTETYPAGRYIDLRRTGTDLYELDFNDAYQPYCYYNASYECPYPPPENRLKVPIHAGERMKKAE